MTRPAVSDVDLNLLRLLRALVDTGSITRAGETVGLSQSAASRAVARLRRTFGDPLLVRTAAGYVLTPLAVQLGPAVRRALAAVDEVRAVARFDPRDAMRRFRIATTDYGLATVVLPLVPALHRVAPGVSIEIDPWSHETIPALERGDLDAALYADDTLPPDFHARRLFDDGYAVAWRHGHPLARAARLPPRRLLAEAAAWPQFAVRYPVERGYRTDDIYRRLRLAAAQVAMAAPYFHAARRAIADAGLVAVLPTRIVRAWTGAPRIDAVPLALPALRFEYRLVWHERAHRDPGLGWLRERIVRAIADRTEAVVRTRYPLEHSG